MSSRLQALLCGGLALVLCGLSRGAEPTPAERLDGAITFAESQLLAAAQSGMATDSYPITARPNWPWRQVTASSWVSGLFPGCLWKAGDLVDDGGSEALYVYARAWAGGIGPTTNNTGFMAFPAHKLWYDHTGDPAARQVVIDAALLRGSVFVPLPDPSGENLGSRGLFRDPNQWDPNRGTFPPASWVATPIDHMMDLQTTFWAAREAGDSDLYAKSVLHARTAAERMLRPDGGAVHWGYYHRTSGGFDSRQYQGYKNHTSWARGQAWAIYGLTVAARETGVAGDRANAADFLADARKAADYWLDHDNLPADGIPVWDFDVPDVLDPLPGWVRTNRDSSAAAIAASAFLELTYLTPEPADRRRYRGAAELALGTLATPKTDGGYLNTDTAGGWAGDGILAHGVYVHSYSAATGNSGEISKNVENDHAAIWGDYFFLEGIWGLLNPPVPGDANRDAVVDAFDLAILANNYHGSGKPWIDGDFNEDGDVNVFDLAALANNYRYGTGGSPIPEPAALALLTLGGLAMVRRKR